MNQIEDDDYVEYTSQNLRFLRKGIGLSINGLASLVDIDPIDLYQMEKEEYKFIEQEGGTDRLIYLSNYFAIPLERIVLTDLCTDTSVPDLFIELRKELQGTEAFNREV